eukprot:TRINITY_DN1431_c0_g1_i1.p2 TRINITY_DN1431_c0_g1~~TRINITY_DN1431_c0_g1_i1.p2  ORF type:complete len:101 (-),score=15.34 TRINITY_DN1431_c0_g1_i1:765-1067(-)
MGEEVQPAVDPIAHGNLDAYWEYRDLSIARVFKCHNCLSEPTRRRKNGDPMPRVMEYALPKMKNSNVLNKLVHCPHGQCSLMEYKERILVPTIILDGSSW